MSRSYLHWLVVDLAIQIIMLSNWQFYMHTHSTLYIDESFQTKRFGRIYWSNISTTKYVNIPQKVSKSDTVYPIGPMYGVLYQHLPQKLYINMPCMDSIIWVCYGMLRIP